MKKFAKIVLNLDFFAIVVLLCIIGSFNVSKATGLKPEIGEVITITGCFSRFYRNDAIRLEAGSVKDRLYKKFRAYEVFETPDIPILRKLDSLSYKERKKFPIRVKMKVLETGVSVIKGQFIEWADQDFVKLVEKEAAEAKALATKRIKDFSEDKNLQTIVCQVVNYYERKNYFTTFYGKNDMNLCIIDVPRLYAPKIREFSRTDLPVKVKVKFLPKEKYRTPEAIFVQWFDVDWNTELERSTVSGVPLKASLLCVLQGFDVVNPMNKPCGRALIKIPSKFLLNGIVLRTDIYDAMKIRAKNNQDYLIYDVPHDGQKPNDNVSLDIRWEKGAYRFISWGNRTNKMLVARRTDHKKQWKEYVTNLKSGKIPITTINDAAIYTNASEELRYTVTPPLNGPVNKNRYYLWQGLITNKFGDIYVSWDPEFERGFAFTKAKKMLGVELRQNGPVAVVGRYVSNYQVTLVIGTKRLIPLLEDCYVFGLR